MEDIMSKILEMTLYGSIAIVMVIIFRAVFHKIPKKITCLFWIAVAVRLLCPFNFSMGFGIANLFEREPVYVTNHADAVMYDQTSIAVVQMLWPWA